MKKVVKKVKDDLCDFKQETQRLKTIREELNKLRKDNWYKIKKSDTYKQQEARLLQEQKEIEQKHNRKQRKYWIVGIVIIFLLFFIIIEIGIATERPTDECRYKHCFSGAYNGRKYRGFQ